MRYEDLIGPAALDAVEALFENNRDLVLSFASVEDVATQLAAFARLNSVSLEKEESVYSAYQKALASLLHQGKVTLKSFGLSRAGENHRDNLYRHAGFLAPEAPAADPYADVVSDWRNLDTTALSQKLQDADYAARYRAAAMDGKFS